MPAELLTIDDVAAVLKCTDRHVRALVAAGRLVPVRFGLGLRRPRKRFTSEEVARYIAAGQEAPPAPEPVSRGRARRLPAVTEWVS